MDLATNEWVLTVGMTGAGTIAASAACIQKEVPLDVGGTLQGGGTLLLGSVIPNRHCFLSGIEGIGSFKSSSDYVLVSKIASFWYLRGKLSGPSSSATALCIDDIPANSNPWKWTSGDPGHRLDNLDYNTGSGIACLLQGVGGSFSTNDSYDGVMISLDVSTQYWVMATSNGKTGWAQCLR